ncbi:MAG: hypothetical protein DRH90_18125 [Deltaproteobacteria bacterium]|nr:MAG: hypothetical protein DRH90_18125 [Deltaproteobacteria bacterium]RLC10022.1 MAG: hypothetical protein DRI24_20895 [Deltaproteobacteria bacterium]
MSSSIVRTLVEGWLNDVAMTVPYYPTVNEDQNPQDNIWCTADFSSSFREAMTFCNGYTNEQGEVEVIYYGLAGIGEDALIAAVEADMATMMAQRDPANKLVLMNRSAPYTFSSGSADREFALSVYIDYNLYE